MHLFRNAFINNRELVLRLLFACFGAGIFLLGVTFIAREWYRSSFFGTLLCFLGIQIALWAIGISFDFLGNVPFYSGIASEKSLISEMALKKKPANLRWEEIENYHPLLVHLKVVIGFLKIPQAELYSKIEYHKTLEQKIEKILDYITEEYEVLSNVLDKHLISDFIEDSSRMRFGATLPTGDHDRYTASINRLYLELLRLKDRDKY